MHRTQPPAPKDPSELDRVNHTRKRRRLLYSQHEQDVIALLSQEIGDVRRKAWGRPDLTVNLFIVIWDGLSKLYAEEPDITPPEGGEEFLEIVAESGIWPLMQRVQRDTLALREMVVRLDVVDGVLVPRPVFPDLVEVEVSARTPTEPIRVTETAEHNGEWVRIIASIEDPAAPFFMVEDLAGRDVTEKVLSAPAMAGDAYPYRLDDGTPILPYVIYHAQESGHVWDPYTLSEIVEGSLLIAVLLTLYRHVVKNGAWAQRYAFGVDVAGAGVDDADGDARAEVVADPATVLMGRFDTEGGQPMIGQWSSPADPEAILRSVLMYQGRIYELAGLQAPGVQKQGADIRSGYSLAVERESASEQQRVFEPMFRRGDMQMLRLAAVLLNRSTGSSHPESGYRIQYRGLPPSPIEERALLEELDKKMQMGLMGPVEAYQRANPGKTQAEAIADLAAIAEEKRRFGVA